MARVTVEDCVLSVPNRFELCLIASKRARNILSGAHSELEDTGEKPTVLALREIGENLIDVEAIKEDLLTTIKNRDSSVVGQSINNPCEEDIESLNPDPIAAAPSHTSGASFVSENIEVED